MSFKASNQKINFGDNKNINVNTYNVSGNNTKNIFIPINYDDIPEIDYSKYDTPVQEENNSNLSASVINNMSSMVASGASKIVDEKKSSDSTNTPFSDVMSSIGGSVSLFGGSNENKTQGNLSDPKVSNNTQNLFGNMNGFFGEKKSNEEQTPEELLEKTIRNSRMEDVSVEETIQELNKLDIKLNSYVYKGCTYNFVDGKCTSILFENSIGAYISYDSARKMKIDYCYCIETTHSYGWNVYNNMGIIEGQEKSMFNNTEQKQTTIEKRSINIFGKYNKDNQQYGGSQMTFEYNNAELLEDPRIMNILEKYYPNGDMEEYQLFLARLCNTGCGYTAIVNSIFEEYCGKEEKFESKFGFPMYTVNAKGEIYFNYEYLILDCFGYVCKKQGYSISELADDMEDVEIGDGSVTGETGDISTGLGTSEVPIVEDYLQSKGLDVRLDANRDAYKNNDNTTSAFDNMMKDVTIDVIREQFKKGNTVILSVSGYDLYTMDGELCTDNGGSHAMTITDIYTEGGETKIIVSSWGEQFEVGLDDATRIGLYVLDYE